MSLRPVKQIIQTKPTIEGAGVKLRRAFGFGKTKDLQPIPPARRLPGRESKITWRDFPGIRTVGSKRSPTYWPVQSSTATVSATRVR